MGLVWYEIPFVSRGPDRCLVGHRRLLARESIYSTARFEMCCILRGEGLLVWHLPNGNRRRSTQPLREAGPSRDAKVRVQVIAAMHMRAGMASLPALSQLPLL